MHVGLRLVPCLAMAALATDVAIAARPGAAAPMLPGYHMRQARDFGVMCNGAKDDTLALKNALHALNPGDALQLPAGTCLTSDMLRLARKSNVAVVGAGKDSTIIQAMDPRRSSFVVHNSSNVRLSGFQVYSPNTGGMKRGNDPNSRGFQIKDSSGVTLDGIKARAVLGAGVFMSGVRDSQILNSEVQKSLADAFHVTGGSQNVVAQGNLAEGAGDDGFASIGYVPQLNHNIQFFDNVVRDGWWGSGVSFEGTIGGKAYRNKIYRSGVAGIRLASQRNWKTGAVDDIDVRDNYLEGCVTRKRTGHGSVMIFTNFQNVGPNISIVRTTIKDPASGPAVRAFGQGATVTAKVEDSRLSGVRRAFAIERNATISTSAGTLLSGRAERK